MYRQTHFCADVGILLISVSCSHVFEEEPGLLQDKNLISAHITQSLNIVIPLRTSLNLVNILRSSSGGRNLREVSARAPLETSLLRLTPLGKRRSSRKFCLSTVAWDWPGGVYAQRRNPGEIDLQGCLGRNFSKTPHARWAPRCPCVTPIFWAPRCPCATPIFWAPGCPCATLILLSPSVSMRHPNFWAPRYPCDVYVYVL